MAKNKVTIEKLKEALNLKQICGNQEALKRWIITPDINRVGLELAGFIFAKEKKRLVILGNKELSYINTLDEKTQRERFEAITDVYTPGIVISSNRRCPNILKEIAKAKNFPILVAMDKSSNLVVDIIGFLEAQLAPSGQVHGCLVSIYGRGVLITGISGIGKSETTLELIRRGHTMVADDAVIVSRIQKRLTGRAPEILYGMLEIRGIGVIDCVQLFGAASVIPEIFIDYQIELISWAKDEVLDRTYFMEQEHGEILGVDIPKIQIPVREGRSLAIIVESAVLNYNLHFRGINSNQEFNEKLISYISKRNN